MEQSHNRTMKEETEVDNFAVSLGISRSELDARKDGLEEGRKEEREKLPPKSPLGKRKIANSRRNCKRSSRKKSRILF